MRIRTAVLLAGSLVACRRSPSAEPPPAAQTAQKAPEPSDFLAKAAKGINDDLLSRFAGYQHDMLAVSAQAVAVGADALRASAQNPQKYAASVRNDGRGEALHKASEEAAKRYGLTEMQVTGLSLITSRYYGKLNQAQMLADTLTDIEKTQSHKTQEGMEKAYSDATEQVGAIKTEYTKRYGALVVGLLDRHWPEYKDTYAELTKELMKDKPRPLRDH